VDAIDFIILILTRGPMMLPLLYVLAILLRAACHFAGVEIPALGRSFVTASATAALTVVVTLILASIFGPVDDSALGLLSLFLTLLFTLLANMMFAMGLYRLLLGVSYNQALSVWLIQAMSFVAFIVAAGCLIGVPYSLFVD
jgi:hypothetical protein